jgi:hypothetical protein
MKKKHRHYFKVCYKCQGSGSYEGWGGYDHKCECNRLKNCRCGAIKDKNGSITEKIK